MKIQYYRKSVYGKELIYLVNTNEAKHMLALISQTTISESQMAHFEVLGVAFEETFAPRQ